MSVFTINGRPTQAHPKLRCPRCGGLVWRPVNELGKPNEAYGWRCCNITCRFGKSPFAIFKSDETPWDLEAFRVQPEREVAHA